MIRIYDEYDNNDNNDKNNDEYDNDDIIMIIKIMMIIMMIKDDKCKFENCNREATYRKLKVGNCHLEDTKYEYCSYHRPKNSINY